MGKKLIFILWLLSLYIFESHKHAPLLGGIWKYRNSTPSYIQIDVVISQMLDSYAAPAGSSLDPLGVSRWVSFSHMYPVSLLLGCWQYPFLVLIGRDLAMLWQWFSVTWTLAVKGPRPGNEKYDDDASCHSSQPSTPAGVHNVPRKLGAALCTDTCHWLPGVLTGMDFLT